MSVNNVGNNQGGNGESPASSGGNTFEVSGDGRFVVFSSSASNLVSGDTNNYKDIFVRDLESNTTTRVSVSTSGVQGNGNAGSGYTGGHVAISETGRYVAFTSQATNLIDGQTVSGAQIYMRDMRSNTTSLVTQTNGGVLGNAAVLVQGVSSDGRFVAWRGEKNTNLYSGGGTFGGLNYLYVADLNTRTFTLVNSGDFETGDSDMSCDGAFMVFSTKDQLVAQDVDASLDIYLLDMRGGLKMVGVTTGSNLAKSSVRSVVSCNGSFVSFSSDDYGLTSIVNSTDIKYHTYLYDRIAGTLSVVDTSAGNVVGNDNSSTTAGVDNSGNTFITTSATNLVGSVSKPQLYLKRKTGDIERLSLTADDGSQSNGVLSDTSVSADGKKVVYMAGSYIGGSNLLPGGLSSDTNLKPDIFMSLTGL